MSSTRPSSTDSRPPSEAVDLGRLRIDRGSGPVRRARGFPFLRLWVALGIVALLLLLREPLLATFGRQDQAGWETALVVRAGGSSGGVMANGYVVAERSASLSTVLSGRLVELRAKEGDIVEANAIVARIQSDDLEAQERQAQSGLEGAAARRAQVEAEAKAARERHVEVQRQLEAARLQFARLEAEIAGRKELAAQATSDTVRLVGVVARNRALRERQLIGADEWDRIETAARLSALARDAAMSRVRVGEAEHAAWAGDVRALEQSVVRAEAEAEAALKTVAAASADEAGAQEALTLAGILVEKTRIRAPFRGLVIRKDAEQGEVLAPTGAGNSRGSVFTIVDPSSLEMQVELSERRLADIAEGERARITLEAHPEQALTGIVRAIWPRADRSKGTVEVRVRFEPLPDGLKPDMAGRVEFLGSAQPADGSKPAGVLVPTRAVVQREGRSVVFVVSDGVARLVPVRTEEVRGPQIVVSEGLTGGERVLLSPAPSLSDGTRQPWTSEAREFT